MKIATFKDNAFSDWLISVQQDEAKRLEIQTCRGKEERFRNAEQITEVEDDSNWRIIRLKDGRGQVEFFKEGDWVMWGDGEELDSDQEKFFRGD